VERSVPALMCVDVEPDDFQLPLDGSGTWDGFPATVELMDEFRDRVADVTGARPSVVWFLRMDPQIAGAFGRADHVAERFGDVLTELRSHGDAIGIHPHAFRWSTERSVWVSVLSDVAWTVECIDVAVESFVAAFGERPLLHCFGSSHFSQPIATRLAEHRLLADVTPEPGVVPWHPVREGQELEGEPTDFRGVPRGAYWPDVEDWRRPAREQGLPLLLVPHTSTAPRRDGPLPRRIGRSIRRGFRTPPMIINPWMNGDAPTTYWDHVTRALAYRDTTHFCCSVRTDAPSMPATQRVRDCLRSFSEHPLVHRLVFSDPIGTCQQLGMTSPRPPDAAAEPTVGPVQ
jgi:hypothetical protein